MRANQFISELRRRPEANPKQDQGAVRVLQLLQQTGTDHVGVSYTQLPKLGINPQSDWHGTPLGIYFYPADYYVEQRGTVPSFGFAKYIQVFRYNTDRILDLNTYTAEQFAQDVGTLGIPTEPTDRPGHQIWNLIKSVASERREQRYTGNSTPAKENQRKNAIWNHVIRTLGYDVVVDYQGIISHKEKTQGLVVNPRVIELIDTIDNQYGNQTNLKLIDRLSKGTEPRKFMKDLMTVLHDPATFWQFDTEHQKRAAEQKIFGKLLSYTKQFPELWDTYTINAVKRIQTLAPKHLGDQILQQYNQHNNDIQNLDGQ
jgi:hypothetical protein